MPHEPPRFWSSAPGTSLSATLLKPLGEVYGAIVAARLERTEGTRVGKPVVCIGNITLGGVGKTPMTRLLIKALIARGEKPAVVSRGYGGSLEGPVKVTPHHTASEVGDEPLMLSADAPVFIAKDRRAGAQMAAATEATVLLMDDGFQNPSVHKDFSLVMIDAVAQLGNGEVFPAGPLREKPRAALARADALVVVLPDLAAPVPGELTDLAGSLPIFRAAFAIDTAAIPQKPLLAFCGIGRPERFLNSLRDGGGDVAAFRAFADHHPFSSQDIKGLKEEAADNGWQLVTTEKDLARLAPGDRDGITLIPGAMTVEGAEQLIDNIARRL